jgi:hypothetical protein
MQTTVFLQAAPAAPRTPTAIAEAARAAVDAGAQSVHVHAFDDAGGETLAGAACAAVLRDPSGLPGDSHFLNNLSGDSSAVPSRPPICGPAPCQQPDKVSVDPSTRK